MSERTQYGELADELEDRADTLAEENRRLGDRIAEVRKESERTRTQAGVTPDWDDPDEDEDEDDTNDDDGDAEEDEAEEDEQE